VCSCIGVAITAVLHAYEYEECREWLERGSTDRKEAQRGTCSTAARIGKEHAITSLETLSSRQYVPHCAVAESCALA